MASAAPSPDDGALEVADWHRRVVDRSLKSATQKSIDRGAGFIRAATTLLQRSDGDGFTVQEVADEAGQSLRTLYQYFESKDDLLLAVFEEAMATYAQMIRAAVAAIDDPLERLAGAVIAASRMPERSTAGVDVGLARLRLKLGGVDPALVARSQEPVLAVFRHLYHDAVAAGAVPDRGEEQAVYLIAALNGAFITSVTLGNEYGLALPGPTDLARFCLQGIGARPAASGADGADDERWYDDVSRRVVLPEGPISPNRPIRTAG